ncbi:hypothetical protein Namu_3594 [Nakamurella multipartita DSM 44233]|jgi:hypothetical protein|uniref:Uncharacterized protein n=1 Tax=Nakamurella multipartita (strain ATCC 700099 / DSM 44233 / CIP 104796 / JCM 9543 / NBRC 105858 / Y-104) TaxID=479431 RepID=C8XFD6_NAKMY|nr:hypothetical protein Namu_3594 [Nakamurella multipartita DSM 44233]
MWVALGLTAASFAADELAKSAIERQLEITARH